MATETPNTDADLFRRWGRLMGGAGMHVKDVGNGIIEMSPDIEFEDEMTDEEREWVLQVPDKEGVTWTIALEVGNCQHTEKCLLAPTMQSKGWFELLTRRNMSIDIVKGQRMDVLVSASWLTTRGRPITQTLSRGHFTVPDYFHTMGAPILNVFMPGRQLLSIHVAIVAGSLRAVAASVRAKLDESPWEEDVSE
jgi:hypothetical protein